MILNKLTKLKLPSFSSQEKISLGATTGILIFVLVVSSMTDPTLSPVLPATSVDDQQVETYDTSTIATQQNNRRDGTQPRVPRNPPVSSSPVRRVASTTPAPQTTTPDPSPTAPTAAVGTVQDDVEVPAPVALQYATATNAAEPINKATRGNSHSKQKHQMTKQEKKAYKKQRKTEKQHLKQLRKQQKQARKWQKQQKKKQYKHAD